MLSKVKILIINELSLVSIDLWADIDSRLGDVFMTVPKKPFADLSDMLHLTCFNYILPEEKPIFSQFSEKDSLKHLLGLQLWHLFKYA